MTALTTVYALALWFRKLPLAQRDAYLLNEQDKELKRRGIRKSEKDKKKDIRQKKCTLLRISRLPSTVGETMERAGAKWRWFRYVAHGANAKDIETRKNEVLAILATPEMKRTVPTRKGNAA